MNDPISTPATETSASAPPAPPVKTVEEQLQEALAQFALTYLRLGDIMRHVQEVLRTARPMGSSGAQVAVLSSKLKDLQNAYNLSVGIFQPGALAPAAKTAVDGLLTELKNRPVPASSESTK